MTFDWKFFATMLATIAGIAVPVWLWQVDLSAHSLSVRLASSVALQPVGTISIPDLQISIDGVNIKSPFISTLELSNDGSRPVPTSDFESPIELSVGQDTQVVRARVSSAEPNDLKAELDTNRQSVKLKPLLLNPKDTLTIAVMTSGGPPTFDVKARIAGISKIKFEDTTTKKKNWKGAAIYFVIALFALILYWVYGAAIIRPYSVHPSLLLSITTMIVCALSGSFALRRGYEAAGMEVAKIDRWPVIVAIILIGLLVFSYLFRRSKQK